MEIVPNIGVHVCVDYKEMITDRSRATGRRMKK